MIEGMTTNNAQKKRMKPGAVLIGFGIGFAVLGVLIPVYMAWSGGTGWGGLILLIPAALLVVIGYLKRISAK